MFKTTHRFMFALFAAALLAACNQAKHPADVAKDVNAASQNATKNTANAEEKAAKTDAEGRRQVALAKCEGLSGDRQQACKDEANASYDMAVAKAKEERSATDTRQ